jgi:hypothetical protein
MIVPFVYESHENKLLPLNARHFAFLVIKTLAF